jgi:WhiB family redox-sensing transcriptional regulator
MNIFAILPLLPKLENASCRDYSYPDLFFGKNEKEEEANFPFAKVICQGCPDKKPCLEFAVQQNIPYGIWAGTTPKMRRSMQAGIPADSIEPLSIADRIRSLHLKGNNPSQIAALVKRDESYVHLALSRTPRNKGEIQSQTTTENLSDDSSSLSESA